MIVRTRILASVFSLLLLPTLFLASANAIPRHGLERPSWTVGDFWNYNLSLSIPDTTGGPPVNGTGTATVSVNRTEALSLGDTVFDTFKLTTETSILLGGSFTVHYTLVGWYLRSDLSLVRSNVSFSFFGLRVSSEETYQPPQTMRWGVASGGSWASNGTVAIDAPMFNIALVQPSSTKFTVGDPEKVATGARVFRTIPIQKTVTINGTGLQTGTGFSYYADEAGLLVWRHLSPDNSVTRIRSFWSSDVGAPVRLLVNGDSGHQASYELTAFRYQADENCGGNDQQNHTCQTQFTS